MYATVGGGAESAAAIVTTTRLVGPSIASSFLRCDAILDAHGHTTANACNRSSPTPLAACHHGGQDHPPMDSSAIRRRTARTPWLCGSPACVRQQGPVRAHITCRRRAGRDAGLPGRSSHPCDVARRQRITLRRPRSACLAHTSIQLGVGTARPFGYQAGRRALPCHTEMSSLRCSDAYPSVRRVGDDDVGVLCTNDLDQPADASSMVPG